MLGLHEHSLSYGQVAVERGTVSLNIMSQRENGFRVNSSAKGSTNAARRAIRVQFVQGGHVSKAILLPYSKPRGYRSRHYITHEICSVL